jgi:tRNA threonylcarbamoyladenosine biosynthesis protein TsaE
MKVAIRTRSERETIQFGKQIGKRLQSGDVVALIGELGAGKTHLIKGLAQGTGVEQPDVVTSPSFTFIHEHKGKIPFYHIDLYRLATEEEGEALGLEEYLGGRGITTIEWADKIPSLLPKEVLWIRMRYLETHARSIRILGKGPRYGQLVKKLREEKDSRIRSTKP